MTKIELIDKAIEIFPSKALAMEWIETPIPFLGMDKPSDLIHTQKGREVVNELLNKIKLGDFS